jgi:hypothetical protein
MYASKSLTEVEQKYQTWELEAYACVWAVTAVFKQYLLPPYGRKFVIYTDNSTVFDQAKTNFSSRVAHWKLRLSEYDYEIKHLGGKLNTLADHLSRCSLRSTCPYGEHKEKPLYQIHTTAGVTIPTNASAAYFPPEDKKAKNLAQFVEQQATDEACMKLWDLITQEKRNSRQTMP